MTLLSVQRHVEHNGETVRDSGWCLSWKWRGWCLWHHSNEEGCRVLQIAGLVLETWS